MVEIIRNLASRSLRAIVLIVLVLAPIEAMAEGPIGIYNGSNCVATAGGYQEKIRYSLGAVFNSSSKSIAVTCPSHKVLGSTIQMGEQSGTAIATIRTTRATDTAAVQCHLSLLTYDGKRVRKVSSTTPEDEILISMKAKPPRKGETFYVDLTCELPPLSGLRNQHGIHWYQIEYTDLK